MLMKFWVAVTDNAWFNFLARLQPDEVNFWQPGGQSTFRAIEPGQPFLFKLHSPQDYIVGGGYFVQHSRLPLSMAWEVFGQKNGAPDFASFRSAILKRRADARVPDPVIGCIVLTEPFFLPPDAWIPAPANWHPSIQQGKTYDTFESIGADLWHRVQVAGGYVLQLPQLAKTRVLSEEPVEYSTPYLTRARLGQGAFRVVVTEAYERRCAMTGERTLPVLDAAHIKPAAESGPHSLRNGILLRTDLHILLDKGYLTLTEDLRVEVSHRIKDDFDNGEQYYRLHGKELLVVPRTAESRPSADFIRWHNDNRFLGG
jgi:putative restriction endonuclease